MARIRRELRYTEGESMEYKHKWKKCFEELEEKRWHNQGLITKTEKYRR